MSITITRSRTALLAGSCAFLFTATATLAQDADPYTRTVDGVTVHFGAVPAEAVDESSTGRSDREMHHQARRGLPGEHHVMVALFDAATGQRITRAEVTAYIAGTAQARSLRVLEPMPIAGAMTFGSYLPLAGLSPREIRIEIRLPGRDRPVRTSFIYPLPEH